MSHSQSLLPSSLEAEILEADTSDPKGLLRAIDAAWNRRHPTLLAWGEFSGFRIPGSTALFLYRLDHRAYAGIIRLAIDGQPSSGSLSFLEAAAKAALDWEDWELLGSLAFHSDVAQEYSQVNPDRAEGQPAAPMAETLGLIGKFCSVFEAKDMEARSYLTAALAYFKNLPGTFVIPRDLLFKEPSAAGPMHEDRPSWALLRLFWRTPRSTWFEVPEAIPHLAKCACPFVRILTDNLERGRALASQPAPARPRAPLANPFEDRITPPDQDEPPLDLGSPTLITRQPAKPAWRLWPRPGESRRSRR
jgi:hypothetical protein